MRVLLRVNSHVIWTDKQKNVRSIGENKGCIIQMRPMFVFTLHHKESKMKMKLTDVVEKIKLAQNRPCTMHLSFRYVQIFLWSSLLHAE